MSANTNISEGGKARPFGPVKILMVQGSDGKYYPWFPESDRALGTLSVDKNGVYKASDKDVYGWSRVSVNVPQNEGVTGRDPDTGEDVYVHPDPSGELVKDVLPVEIRVIEPPMNPYGTYVDGQTITKDGMVVKAYGANGDEMMTVPIGEITINPTTAVYDQSTDYGYGIAELDGTTVNYLTRIASSTDYGSDRIRYTNIYIESGWMIAEKRVNNLYIVTGFSLSPTSIRATHNPQSGEPSEARWNSGDYTFYTSKGTRYYRCGGIAFYNISPAITDEGTNVKIGALIDGTKEQSQSGSHQQITVSWPRPGDGAILETSFDINVGPHGGTGDD